MQGLLLLLKDDIVHLLKEAKELLNSVLCSLICFLLMHYQHYSTAFIGMTYDPKIFGKLYNLFSTSLFIVNHPSAFVDAKNIQEEIAGTSSSCKELTPPEMANKSSELHPILNKIIKTTVSAEEKQFYFVTTVQKVATY